MAYLTYCHEPDCFCRDSRVEHVTFSGEGECTRCPTPIKPRPAGAVRTHAFVFYGWTFCSEECALEWLKETVADRNPTVCAVCNEQPSEYAGVCFHCLNKERDRRGLALARRCTICSIVFMPDEGEVTCSPDCRAEAQRRLRYRRRALLAEAFVEDVVRSEIFERDDYTCQLCGDGIDMTIEFPDRMAPTIDHIIPLARGGTHEPSNVQAAHFVCNVRKGTRT